MGSLIPYASGLTKIFSFSEREADSNLECPLPPFKKFTLGYITKGKYFSRHGDIFFHPSESFLLKIKPNYPLERQKALRTGKYPTAFVVSGKVAESVKRQKIRRRLRAIFYELLNLLEIPVTYTFIVRVRSRLDLKNFAELRAEFEKILRKFKKYKLRY